MSGACIVGLYHAVPCCTVLVPCCTMLYRVVPCLHHVVTCCTVRVPGCTMLYHVVPCLYHPCTMLYRAVARSSLCFECACKKPDRPACCSIASSTAPREARSCCDCPTENRCKCGDSMSYRGVSDVSRTAGPLRLLWARAISNCDYGRFES